MDFAGESIRVKRGLKSHFNKLNTCDRQVIYYFIDTDPSRWIPLTIFPLLDYRKEGKMSLAFEPFDASKLEFFKRKVSKFLLKTEIRRIFVPPAEALFKSGSTKYNDGGIVRKDSERPQLSFDSKFKYQCFITRPLVPREVWLPGKSLKVNNAFWMIIGRQILRACPAYPDVDPLVTWERIKDSLSEVYRFDISGFGFQYPREYLAIIAELISSFYPDPFLEEQKDIMLRFLNEMSVEMEDGTFVYPPRGIGLGYYEDLKTIGMLALLSDYDPISVYGDQGLLKPSNGQLAVDVLRSYGFILKEKKAEYKQLVTLWSGWSMSVDKCYKPRVFWDGIFGAFSAQEHWERKASLRSFSEEYEEYSIIDEYIAFHYEKAFGFEFSKGESYLHFDNMGVRSSVPRINGYRREWRLRKLQTPSTTYNGEVFYDSPFLIEVNRKSANEFSKLRQKTWKYSKEFPTEYIEYVYPVIIGNKKRNTHLSKLGSVLPYWADLKMVFEYGQSSGTITSGLEGEELIKAVHNQRFASDPFLARATGGYSISTLWRTDRPESLEEYIMGQELSTMNLAESFYVKRFDAPLVLADAWRPNFNLYDYVMETGELVRPQGIKRPRPLSTISRLSRERQAKRRILPSSYKVSSERAISLSNISDLLADAADVVSSINMINDDQDESVNDESLISDDLLYLGVVLDEADSSFQNTFEI